MELSEETADPTMVERSRAEGALHASEQKYYTLFMTMQQGFCIIEKVHTDPGQPLDFRYLSVNPAFKRHSGLSEPVGHTLRQLVPDVEDSVTACYDRVVQTGKTEKFETYVSTIDLWIEAEVIPTEIPNQIAVLFNDVSERKRAEATLRASQELLSLTIESAVDYAIFTTDPEGTITDWNVGAERVFGFPEHEALGAPFAMLFTPEDQEAGIPQTEFALAQEQGKAIDDRWHMHKDGSRFYANGTVAPLWVGERLVGYVKIARDLTQQQHAEEEREMLLKAVQDFNIVLEKRVAERTEELERSNTRFSQAFALAPYAATISTLDKRETFLEVNQAFLELTRYKREEIIGKTAFNLKMWSSSQDQRQLAQAQKDSRGFRDLALQLVDKEGNLLDLLLSAAVIRLDGHEGYLKMFYDVTEKKRSDEQMMLATNSLMAEASWFSQEFVARLNHIRSGGRIEDYQPIGLSAREREVLRMVAKGWTNKRISEELGLKQQTIRNYLSNIFDKLNVHSRTEAAVWARERGLIG